MNSMLDRKVIGYVDGQPVFSIFGGDTGSPPPSNRAGYNSYGDILWVTADGVDINGLWEEAQLVIDFYNQQRSALVNLFTFPVIDPVETVPQIGAISFDEASEYGVPTSARAEIAYYQMGYDFKDYDKATRFTWRYLRDADSRAIAALHNEYLTADNRLLFRKIMEAIFDNRDRQADIRNRPYNVYPLYNNDGVVPPPYGANTFDGTHNHYLVSGNTQVDSQDIEGMYDHIQEHGYGIETGATFVLLANRAQIQSIRTFRHGVANFNSAVAAYDFIPSPNQPAVIIPNAEGLLGSLPPDDWRGLRVTGSYGDILIIEETYMPAGYMLMFATGGANNLQNLVGLREHANPAYRGLRLLPGNQSNYPLIESFYSRSFGTGVRQRAGGVVIQLKASGSYDIPTQYELGMGLV